MARVIRHLPPQDNETGMLWIKRIGEKWSQVKAEMDDGSIRWLWVSDTREGHFKQVFVPFDFDHPSIL